MSIFDFQVAIGILRISKYSRVKTISGVLVIRYTETLFLFSLLRQTADAVSDQILARDVCSGIQFLLVDTILLDSVTSISSTEDSVSRSDETDITNRPSSRARVAENQTRVLEMHIENHSEAFFYS